MTAPESPFGPVRKWGTNTPRWDPNAMHDLDAEAEWQAIVRATGDLACTDEPVQHEDTFEVRRMAMLTYKPMSSPTNTVAMQTAPVIERARFRHVVAGRWFIAGWVVLFVVALRWLT